MSRPIYGTTPTPTLAQLTSSSVNSKVCKDIRDINTLINTHVSILENLMANKDKSIAKTRLDLLEVRIQSKITEINKR